jgi:hypothetical protein
MPVKKECLRLIFRIRIIGMDWSVDYDSREIRFSACNPTFSGILGNDLAATWDGAILGADDEFPDDKEL